MLLISQLTQIVNVLVAFGFTLENILLPLLFILVPFLGLTIPIAFLFAVFLGFSRFSADGEFSAMLASGYSVKKALVPVLILGFILYGIGAFCSTYFEAWGRREAVKFTHRKTKTMLDNLLTAKLQPGIFLNDFLGYVLYAESISKNGNLLQNVMLSPGPNISDQNFVLLAPSATIDGRVKKGYLNMNFEYGVLYSPRKNAENISVIKFKSAKLDLLRIFGEQIFGKELSYSDYRSLPPDKLKEFIAKLRSNGENPTLLNKAEYLWHQRIASPFIAIVFAMCGIMLGISHDRKGKTHGYLLTMATVIMVYIISLSFKWITERGYVAPLVGAWLPNLILVCIAGILIYQKNYLPPSESVFNIRLWFKRFIR